MGVSRRRETLAVWAGISGDECPWEGGMDVETADNLVENAVGVLGIPLGVAPNFLVDGYDLIVPMAIEEPSVIAAAANAARIVRGAGGFRSSCDDPLTTAQVELLHPVADASSKIMAAQDELINVANSTQPHLVSLGGGARRIVVREHVGCNERLVVHLVVDCKDAMGANMVNTMAEAIAGRLAALSGARVGLKILSNLADERLARAVCSIPVGLLARGKFDGETIAAGVVEAAEFATADPYRAATHNKGIFNGIDAVLLASGNDWRAVEAGGHAYAARSGGYGPLSSWHLEGGMLHGSIEMPMALGIVPGTTSHATAIKCIRIMGVETAGELARIVVCVGLASNLAALSALAGEGIQAGHMRLHRRRFDAPSGGR